MADFLRLGQGQTNPNGCISDEIHHFAVINRHCFYFAMDKRAGSAMLRHSAVAHRGHDHKGRIGPGYKLVVTVDSNLSS